MLSNIFLLGCIQRIFKFWYFFDFTAKAVWPYFLIGGVTMMVQLAVGVAIGVSIPFLKRRLALSRVGAVKNRE